MGAIRNLAKRVLFSVLEPASRMYLSKERKYRFKGLLAFVPPTVFHPAFYLSTPILLEQLEPLALQGL
ncbi:MAG: methyltransferase, partial [Bacteroidota bacterium]